MRGNPDERGSYFRWQVADFVCLGRKLVIELDGSQHALPQQIARDRQRTQSLEASGFRVLRFRNSDFTVTLTPNPSPQGRGAGQRS